MMAAKVIALFNHKGGVGKTTLCYNLSYALAKKGAKVSLIDADSQGNLTNFFVGFDKERKSKTKDLFSAGEFDLTHYLSLHEHLSSYLFLNEPKSSKIAFQKTTDPNDVFGRIKLVCGGIETSKFDIELIDAIQKPNSRTTQHFPAGFKQAIDDCGALGGDKSDFILIDLSPSLSIFNMLAVMSSDYFIVPVNPAYFSLQAIENLSSIFKEWNRLIDPYRIDKLNLNGIKAAPKFLGLVLQNYNIYDNDNNEGAVVEAFGNWAKKVNSAALDLARTLYPTEMAVSEDDFKKLFKSKDPFFINQISKLNRLAAISEDYGVPVTALERGMLKGRDYLNQADLDNITKFNQAYDEIADGLLNLQN